MARRTKEPPGKPTAKGSQRPVKTGRVTPKRAAATAPKSPPPPSGRYTPPAPRDYRESPRWVPVLLLIFLIGGMLTIVCNYLGVLPGGHANNAYLLAGLGLITCGFITATHYR